MRQGTSLKNILPSICGHRLSDPQELINLFKYETANKYLTVTSATILNVDNTVKLKTLLTHYFNGCGHPMHVNWDLNHVDQEAHNLVSSDRLMQSRRFLLMVTGRELLPSDKDMHLYVGFKYSCHHVKVTNLLL